MPSHTRSTVFIHQRDIQTPQCPSEACSQTSRETSAFILKKNQNINLKQFMRQNEGYFDHLQGISIIQGKCVCFQCKCGRCKCQYKSVKFHAPITKTTNYSNDFKHSDNKSQISIPHISKWHSHNENGKQITMKSTVQADFQQYKRQDHDLKEEIAPKKARNTNVYQPPQSSYQFNFCSQNTTWVPPSMPNLNQLGNSTGDSKIIQSKYQIEFARKDQLYKLPAFQYADNLKSINLPFSQTTYQSNHNGSQNEPTKTFRSSHKQIIYARTQRKVSPKKKKTVDEFQRKIFVTEQGRKFRQNFIEICPSKSQILNQK